MGHLGASKRSGRAFALVVMALGSGCAQVIGLSEVPALGVDASSDSGSAVLPDAGTPPDESGDPRVPSDASSEASSVASSDASSDASNEAACVGAACAACVPGADCGPAASCQKMQVD